MDLYTFWKHCYNLAFLYLLTLDLNSLILYLLHCCNIQILPVFDKKRKYLVLSFCQISINPIKCMDCKTPVSLHNNISVNTLNTRRFARAKHGSTNMHHTLSIHMRAPEYQHTMHCFQTYTPLKIVTAAEYFLFLCFLSL